MNKMKNKTQKHREMGGGHTADATVRTQHSSEKRRKKKGTLIRLL